MEGPFALAADGSAKDPAAFQQALRSDAAKMQQLQQTPELQSILLGSDYEAMQKLLRQAYQVGACCRLSATVMLSSSISINGSQAAWSAWSSPPPTAPAGQSTAPHPNATSLCPPLRIHVFLPKLFPRSHAGSPLCCPPQAQLDKAQNAARFMAERSMDAQRASATVPRDTVQLYQQLAKSGLQYGPAFRLLRNVHVPDSL